jgi:predicted Fe-Mo cluster-binding NifX family protein
MVISMRYLLPTNGRGSLDEEVARYFGQAANFVVVFERKGQLTVEEVVKNTYDEIDFPAENVAALAASGRNINVVLADNMLDESRVVLEKGGIKVSLGHHRISLKHAIKDYLKKRLT